MLALSMKGRINCLNAREQLFLSPTINLSVIRTKTFICDVDRMLLVGEEMLNRAIDPSNVLRVSFRERNKKNQQQTQEKLKQLKQQEKEQQQKQQQQQLQQQQHKQQQQQQQQPQEQPQQKQKDQQEQTLEKATSNGKGIRSITYTIELSFR